PCQIRRKVGPQLLDRRRLFSLVPCHLLRRCASEERHPPGEEEIKDAAQAVHLGSNVDLRVWRQVIELLRRVVLGSGASTSGPGLLVQDRQAQVLNLDDSPPGEWCVVRGGRRRVGGEG